MLVQFFVSFLDMPREAAQIITLVGASVQFDHFQSFPYAYQFFLKHEIRINNLSSKN